MMCCKRMARAVRYRRLGVPRSGFGCISSMPAIAITRVAKLLEPGIAAIPCLTPGGPAQSHYYRLALSLKSTIGLTRVYNKI